MFIDTHCHLDMIATRLKDSEQNTKDIQLIKKVIEEALSQQVTRFITVGVDLPTNRMVLNLAANETSVYGACGIHPCDAINDWHIQIEELKNLIKQNLTRSKLVAIGEIGLDFFHQPVNRERQRDIFKTQIEFALSLGLPIIVHSRNAIEETLEIIDEFTREPLKGVFHCFSENRTYALEIIKRGFYLGVAGHITYPKNEELRAAISHVGLNYILLETDAPFLPPQTIRGKMNTPAQVATIGSFLATLFGKTCQEVASITTSNAEKLFHLIRKTS